MGMRRDLRRKTQFNTGPGTYPGDTAPVDPMHARHIGTGRHETRRWRATPTTRGPLLQLNDEDYSGMPHDGGKPEKQYQYGSGNQQSELRF